MISYQRTLAAIAFGTRRPGCKAPLQPFTFSCAASKRARNHIFLGAGNWQPAPCGSDPGCVQCIASHRDFACEPMERKLGELTMKVLCLGILFLPQVLECVFFGSCCFGPCWAQLKRNLCRPQVEACTKGASSGLNIARHPVDYFLEQCRSLGKNSSAERRVRAQLICVLDFMHFPMAILVNICSMASPLGSFTLGCLDH